MKTVEWLVLFLLVLLISVWVLLQSRKDKTPVLAYPAMYTRTVSVQYNLNARTDFLLFRQCLYLSSFQVYWSLGSLQQLQLFARVYLHCPNYLVSPGYEPSRNTNICYDVYFWLFYHIILHLRHL